jgi:hypothetical protein
MLRASSQATTMPRASTPVGKQPIDQAAQLAPNPSVFRPEGRANRRCWIASGKPSNRNLEKLPKARDNFEWKLSFVDEVRYTCGGAWPIKLS